MITNRSKNNLPNSVWKEKLLSNPNAIILDVRPNYTGKSKGLSNSLPLDPTHMQDLIKSLDKMDRTQTYFLYCEDGEMSNQVSYLMDSLGFEKTHCLVGGLKKLENEMTNI